MNGVISMLICFSFLKCILVSYSLKVVRFYKSRAIKKCNAFVDLLIWQGFWTLFYSVYCAL